MYPWRKAVMSHDVPLALVPSHCSGRIIGVSCDIVSYRRYDDYPASSKTSCQGHLVVYLAPLFLEEGLSCPGDGWTLASWYQEPTRRAAMMAFLSLTPCQFWPCSGSFCLIYFTCIKSIHQLYHTVVSYYIIHTHALDSWKSPAALPAGLLVLCRAGQLW